MQTKIMRIAAGRVNKMESTINIKTHAKEFTCPSCGSPKLRKDYMREEGVDIPIKRCSDCQWWG